MECILSHTMQSEWTVKYSTPFGVLRFALANVEVCKYAFSNFFTSGVHLEGIGHGILCFAGNLNH